MFEKESGAFAGMTAPGGPVYGLELLNGGIVTFPGGVPIWVDNIGCIGAIGVSGGSVEDDLKIAKAGASAVEYKMNNRWKWNKYN